MTMRKLLLPAVVVACFNAAPAFAYNQDDVMTDDAIRARVQPFGSIVVGGSASAEPSGPRSGETVFQSNCNACHGSGAMGAPKFGDAAAWGPRAEQGMDVLLEHALNGLNQMPAKGLCGDCSDDEIKAAIQYMLDGSL